MPALSVTDLDALPASEQRAIFDRLAHRFNNAGNKAASLSALESETWEALCEALGQGHVPPAPFITSFGKARYKESCEAIRKYLESGAGIQRKPVMVKLTKMVLRCLVNWLRNSGAQPTPSRVFSSISMLPLAVDESYPGYADAGLLARIAPIAI